DGVAVMPFACVLQMLSEAPAAFGIDRPVVALEDVRMFSGLTLRNGARDVRFVIEETVGDDTLRIGVFSDESAERPHYRGRVRLGSGFEPAPRRAPDATARRPWTGQDIGWIYRRWLSHGPRFQTLSGIAALDGTGIRAHAAASRPAAFLSAAAGRSWTFDPALIDGALQTLWIWTRAAQN